MGDSYVRKGVAPPPVSEDLIAQRRRQKRLVLSTLFGILAAVAIWQGYVYFGAADERKSVQLEAGIALMTPGHYEEAIAELTRAISLDPESSSAYFNRALAHQNLASPEAALADYQEALNLNPNLVDAHTAMAAIYRDRGDAEAALESLNRSIDVEPTVAAYYQRAATLASLSRHEEAIADYTWVIQQMRDAPYVYFARASSRRALGDEFGAKADEETAYSFDRSKQLTERPPLDPAAEAAAERKQQ